MYNIKHNFIKILPTQKDQVSLYQHKQKNLNILGNQLKICNAYIYILIKLTLNFGLNKNSNQVTDFSFLRVYIYTCFFLHCFLLYGSYILSPQLHCMQERSHPLLLTSELECELQYLQWAQIGDMTATSMHCLFQKKVSKGGKGEVFRGPLTSYCPA